MENEILDRVKQAVKGWDVPLPEVAEYGWEGDAVENFRYHLQSFDGRSEVFATREEALAWLCEELGKRGDKRVFSSIAEIPGNISAEEVRDPHNAAAVDLNVTEALLGVGEMGSLWVTDESLIEPACALLACELYILIDRKKIVAGMHEAYSSIDLDGIRYGSFFTGPSATADIEAVHITGAQGPLSLTALIY
ncbi:MAG: LUD domain-containing protein [Candidatus Amulumruptor caecigallinarius]|nr:LUD domain-containing protein [Candidatus Amulumruptor caecigallinarius]